MRTLIAASALIFTSTVAFADPMHCVFNQTDGTEILYSFEKVTDDFYAEVSFEKNGTVTRSPTGKRPPWKRMDLASGVSMTYLRDSRFWIGIPNGRVENTGTVVRKMAFLFKDKRMIGKGGCGFILNDLQDGL